MEKLQDREKGYEVLSPGHGTVIATMMSQSSGCLHWACSRTDLLTVEHAAQRALLLPH